MINLGINGFGRIGRLASRLILQGYKDKIKLKAINTSGRMETKGWVQLFKYDSIYRQYPGEVRAEANNLVVDGQAIPILGEPNPALIPWEKYGVEVVIESTGVFRTEEEIKKHLRGTVKKVILSAPAKNDNTPVYLIGVNDEEIKGEQIISSASCTTNCVAPLIKVLDSSVGIKKALMSTIHAYTSDQELLDGSHTDLRRSRAAAINIVPTTTGAALTTAKAYPQVKGIFDGLAIRVPVPVGSLTDLVFLAKRKTTVEEINNILAKAAQNQLKGILGTSNEPLVSSDIIGSSLSCIVDLTLTLVSADDLVKVIAWYDNEWGYTNRLVETVLKLC